jgi:AcrR family transcriptional regulator
MAAPVVTPPEAPAHPEGVAEAPGLRERKKRETARAIEVAAIELAAEHPLAEVTVEAVSARADVTSRTFFNYYASKEDALLGISRAFPRRRFTEVHYEADRSVIELLLGAVIDELGELDIGPADFQAKKRAVMLENPHLLARDFQTMGDIEAELVTAAERLLDAEGEVPEADRGARAWAIVTLVGGVLRLAMQRWSRDSGARAPVGDHVADALRTLRTVARDA